MSWSQTFGPLTLEELDELKPNETVRSRNQFEEALHAAVHIAESGVLGDPKKIRFSGSLFGHENENHVPPPGWSPDSVGISISQAREPSELDKAANS
jgi:hypothetical protein